MSWKRGSGAALAALAAGVALGACRPSSGSSAAPAPLSALPLTNAAAAPPAEAPAAGALPAAPPPPIDPAEGPGQGFAYVDRAWWMSDAFDDSPPDYAFDAGGGVTPWMWIASDGSECVAEPVPGGERYYYYQPGATWPFYVQDPDYGYGFSGGALVAVFNADGEPLPGADYGRYDPDAGRYLARGKALRQEAATSPRQAVAASSWAQRRSVIAGQRTRWSDEAARSPAWSAYHAQHAPAAAAQWRDTKVQRENWAATTDARLGDQAGAARERKLAETGRGRPARPAQPARPVAAPARIAAAPAVARHAAAPARTPAARVSPAAARVHATPTGRPRPQAPPRPRSPSAPGMAFAHGFHRAPRPPPAARPATAARPPARAAPAIHAPAAPPAAKAGPRRPQQR